MEWGFVRIAFASWRCRVIQGVFLFRLYSFPGIHLHLGSFPKPGMDVAKLQFPAFFTISCASSVAGSSPVSSRKEIGSLLV